MSLKIFELRTRMSNVMNYGTYVPFVDGLMLDSGFRRARGQLVAQLGDRHVEQIANTHAHEDHFGNNAYFAGRGAKLFAPAPGIDDMDRPAEVAVGNYQRVVWGIPEPCHPDPLGEKIETSQYAFDVVPTPGHSPDHVCFFEPRQSWLFSGDLFLSVKVRVARPFENANDLLASLRRVRALEPERMFCYHRGEIADPAADLTAKINFMDETRGRVLKWKEAGLPPREITRRVLGRDDPMMWLITWGDMARVNLVKAFLK